MNSRSFVLLCTSVMLVACSSGDDEAGATKGTGQVAQSGEVRNIIEDLESRGEIPKLDTSEDIVGDDQDGNGVRDDIDRYLDSLPDTTIQKESLRQFSRAIRDSLKVDLQSADPELIREARVDITNAVNCISYTYAELRKFSRRADAVLRYNLNTPGRLLSHDRFSARLDGLAIEIPAENTCDE